MEPIEKEKEKEEITEVKIRKLKVADRKRFSALIEKLTEKIGDDSLLNAISSAITERRKSQDDDSKNDQNDEQKEEQKDDENIIKVGIKIFKALLKTLEDETHEWFADLVIGIDNKEDFLELPIDSEVRIIEQMIQAEEAKSFFTIVSRLYKRIEKYQNKFTKTRDKLDSKTD